MLNFAYGIERPHNRTTHGVKEKPGIAVKTSKKRNKNKSIWHEKLNGCL